MSLLLVHTGFGRTPSRSIRSGFLLQASPVPIRRDRFPNTRHSSLSLFGQYDPKGRLRCVRSDEVCHPWFRRPLAIPASLGRRTILHGSSGGWERQNQHTTPRLASRCSSSSNWTCASLRRLGPFRLLLSLQHSAIIATFLHRHDSIRFCQNQISSSNTRSPCDPSSHNISNQWFFLVGTQHHPDSPCSWRVHYYRRLLCAYGSAHIDCHNCVPIHHVHDNHKASLPLCTKSCLRCARLLMHPCGSPL